MSIFKLKENETTIRTEVVAGVTTFMTMAYIIFVQAQVQGAAGMDTGAVMVATCSAAAVATLIMGLVANYPIGLAPGMGENFFFAYTVVLGMGIPWQKGLGIVFISGCLFAFLSVIRVRKMILNAVPECLKHAIAVGIGLFIALIGFHDAGIVVQNPAALVTRGDLTQPPVLLSLAGLIIIAILYARGVRGALLIGMLATAVLGIVFKIITFHGVVSAPPSMAPTFLQMDVMGVLHWEYAVPIFTFLYMVMFDTVGTLIGVASQAGLMKNGELPRASRALFADAAGTMTGAVCGVSTVTSYIESVAGVKAGGRTGLTAVVISVLFVAAIFFYPLVETLSGGIALAGGLIVHPITAPALIIVGALMMGGILNIAWSDITEALPAFLTIVAIPFTYNIADGIALGFVSYPLIKLAAGRAREASVLAYALAIVFVLRYALLK